MTVYMITPLGDPYRLVFYLGKKWCRVQSGGFWSPAGGGWTTCVPDTNGFGGKLVFSR